MEKIPLDNLGSLPFTIVYSSAIYIVYSVGLIYVLYVDYSQWLSP